jgi:hypothetical protein
LKFDKIVPSLYDYELTEEEKELGLFISTTNDDHDNAHVPLYKTQ